METREEIQILERYIADFWQFLPIPVCYVNSLNIIINVAANFENFSGYKSDEIAGVNMEKLFANQQKIKGIEQEILNIGSISNREAIFITKEKKKIPVLLSAIARKEDGNTIGYFLSIMDIAERKQVEAKLVKIVDGSTIPAFVINGEHKITHWNTAVESLTGVKREEVVGTDKQWIAFYASKRAVMADLIVDEASKREFEAKYGNKYKKSSLIEDAYDASDFFPALGKEGKWLLFTAAPLRDFEGKVIGAIETLQDITESKKAEDELKKKTNQLISNQKELEKLYAESEGSQKSLLSILEDVSEKEKALRESHERFQNIAANTGDWIWETDTKGRYTYCSPIIKQVLGYEYQEMLGKYFYELSSPDEREQLEKTSFERSKKKEKIKNLVSQNIHKDGHAVFLETNATPLFDNKGNLLGYRGVTRDITERKRAEQTQSVLYNIADAVNSSRSLDELFKTIHKQLSTIIDTTNYYIALYNKETDTISLAYDMDQKDKFISFPAGKTLTAYVIKTGKSLLADEEVSEKLTQAGEVELVGTPSKIWLGVPLKIENEVIGVVVVQSYTDASLYTKKDLEILEFVSDQIAIAIERKRTEEARRKSEKHFRDTIENIFKFVPDSLLVFTDKLNLFRENKAFQDIIQKYATKLNYTEPELKKIITEQIKNKITKKDHTEIRISKKYDK